MKKKITKTLAQLQSERKLCEQEITAAAAKTDAAGKMELKAANSNLENIDYQIEARTEQDAKADADALQAKAAVAAMVKAGQIAPQDTELQARWTQTFTNTPESIALHAGEALKAGGLNAGPGGKMAPVAGALNAAPGSGRVAAVAGAITAVDGRINKFALEAGSSYSFDMNSIASSGFDACAALAGYAELQYANERCGWNKEDRISQEKKHNFSVEAANWYKKHLAPHHAEWQDIPMWQVQKMVKQDNGLSASDYTSGTLGTLSGTLVLQRCLPNFAFDYPELLALYTDFSDTPGLYNQTETTRIVVQAAVQTYNPALSGGYPIGWSTNADGTGTTVDAPITLTDYIGVPIVVGNNVLASTQRRLFDEQAYLSIKGIAGYFTGMLTNLLTTQNFDAYANATTNFASGGVTYGGQVTTPMAAYNVNSGTFALSDIDRIGAAFSSMKIPKADRGILLNPTFYAKLRSDPRFYFLYAAAAKSIASPSDYLSEPQLPRVSGFAPYEAAYLPTATPSQVTAANPAPVVATTANVAGWAFHKAGVMLKSRLPQDFTQAVQAMVPGSVTTITDPDTKISVMLVQYVDLIKNYATWRPEIILGAAVGDFRGGLVLQGT